MKSFLKFVKLNAWIITAIIAFAALWVSFDYFCVPNYEKEAKKLELEIQSVQEELEAYNKKITKYVIATPTYKVWKSKLSKDFGFSTLLIEDDSLIYWTDNKFDAEAISKGVENGIVSTNNGYYLLATTNYDRITIVNSFLIRHKFPYENENLANRFSDRIHLTQAYDISLKNEEGYKINSKTGKFLFSIIPTGENNTTPNQELFIFTLYLIGVFSLFLVLGKVVYKLKLATWVKFTIFPIVIITLRILSFKNDWLAVFNGFELLSPDLYASSTIFPNLAEFSLNIVLLALIVWWILKFFKSTNTILVGLFYLLVLSFSLLISLLFRNVIENSSIPMEVDQLFSLNRYSLLVLLGIGLLFYLFFNLARRSIALLKKSKLSVSTIVLFWFVSSFSYFLFNLFYLNEPFFIALWPLVILGVLFYIEYKFKGEYSFGLGVLILSIFSIYSAFNLSEFNSRNEYQKRVIYANQLANEYDPNAELEYLEVQNKLRSSKFIQKVLLNTKVVGVNNFNKNLEEECFSEFWERYQLEFYLYDSEFRPVINYNNKKGSDFIELDEIIREHGKQSEIAPHLFYVEDYYDKLSYIAKEKLVYSDSISCFLVTKFKSKRIPEQIGFPRLLINDKAKVFEELEQYSMAKYQLGKLVSRYNSYNYPLDENAFLLQFDKNEGFVEDDEMSHYIYHDNDLNTIVLSKAKLTSLSVLTSFSYLFTFFGVLLVVTVLFHDKSLPLAVRKVNLSLKIQLVLISLVVVALIVFGLVAGSFVKSQYNTYTNANIQERIYSVNTEVKQKLGDREVLSKDLEADYMEYILQKFSRVFVTDINLYGLNGSLLASSQPKIYDMGLITSKIHPDAYRELEHLKRSEFIHNEKIGDLNYLSAYIPFVNKKGKKLAYLNLQYFAKQDAYENQISGFLVAIINLAVLLIVSTIVIAIFVTNWITSPLRLIQRSFSKVELGKTNQEIDYKGDDEIGAMVREYNAKLGELEIKAMQLAKSERESAWREMAKQVAHEIKNPLTPMKLRLQHFQRSFNASDENAKEKLDKVSASLIEQIDALTNIANEFSNFAKMPKPSEEKLNIVPLLENCIILFKDVENVSVKFQSEFEELEIYADKNLMLRVFNNLIKNAIQAIPENKSGKVLVTLLKKNTEVLIEVKDNGVGIGDDKRNKIFVPNFTTKSTGTGLGLAMVKQIVENHNGNIWFESEENIGTVFSVVLPIKKI